MKARHVRSFGVDQFVIQVLLLSFWSKRRVSSWILPHKWHPSLVTLHHIGSGFKFCSSLNFSSVDGETVVLHSEDYKFF